MMQLSITSDYFDSHTNPLPYLERIAVAGFTHIHWCHHWDTDYLYSTQELEQIDACFRQNHLRLLNLHASHGAENYWVSHQESQRLAGLGLVRNRLQMTARLGGEVVIIHIPTTAPPEVRPARLTQIRRSLDAIEPDVREHGLKLALENMAGDDFEMLSTLFSEYPADFLGLCYDSGHANMGRDGLQHLEQWRSRLIAIHLHDNDGINDQHKVPFTGTIDWSALVRLIAASAYQGCINLEVVIRESGFQDEAEFLRQSHLAGEKLDAMLTLARQAI